MAAKDYEILISALGMTPYFAKVNKRNPDLMLEDRRKITDGEILMLIDCYMKNIDDLYTGLDTCTLSYENGADGTSGTWYLKRGDSTYITLKVTQTQKQEGQS